MQSWTLQRKQGYQSLYEKLQNIRRSLWRGDRHDRQADITRRARRVPDALHCFLIVAGLRIKNVRHKGLRIAVVEREERRLHLHHDAVAALEGVVDHREAEGELRRLVGREGGWVLE